MNTVEPHLRGHLDERPTLLERSLDNVYLNISVLISTQRQVNPLERPDFWRKSSHEGFHCILKFCEI